MAVTTPGIASHEEAKETLRKAREATTDAKNQEEPPKAAPYLKPEPKVPSLGRIIHVVADVALAAKLNCREGRHVAAIVVASYGNGTFNATAFSPTGNYPVLGLPFTAADYNEAGIQDRSWHWPEREE